MARLRALTVLCFAVSLAVSACGDSDSPGGDGSGGVGGQVAPGGSGGGEGGQGGEGGSGGNVGKPRVDAFQPPESGRGFRIRVVGKNFHLGAPRNKVLFASQEGAEIPSLESVGVAAAPDGSWFEVIVPRTAHTGPTRILTDHDGGTVTLDGPVFTVTEATLPPTVQTIEPTAFTAGLGDYEFVVDGKEFHAEKTTILVGGKAATIDWSQSTDSRLVATLPEALVDQPGNYELFVETPPPGGGKAGPHSMRVVEPLRLLSVSATSPTKLTALFDRGVNRSSAQNRDNFSIAGISQAFEWSQRVHGVSSAVELTLRSPLEVGTTYTLIVSPRVVSTEGGAITDNQAEFEAFDPSRELIEEIGGPGCGADSFSDPTGIVRASDRIYVVERGGAQVQVLGRDGAFIGFYGDDGSGLAFHQEGAEAGCEGGTAGPDALASPVGRVFVATGGRIVVGDTDNGRVLVFTGEGVSVLVEGLPDPAVLMGYAPELGVAVTTGEGRFEAFDLDSGESVHVFGGDNPGSGRDDFNFALLDGGIPSLLPGSGPSASMYIVDPGNHRVSRWSRFFGDWEGRGSIGSGSTSFSRTANGEAGVTPGTFTFPVGIAADADGQLYVVDSAGGEDGGGRLQAFRSSGQQAWVMKLDYVPGGIEVDEGTNTLWITNRSRNSLMKYKLR